MWVIVVWNRTPSSSTVTVPCVLSRPLSPPSLSDFASFILLPLTSSSLIDEMPTVFLYQQPTLARNRSHHRAFSVINTPLSPNKNISLRPDFKLPHSIQPFLVSLRLTASWALNWFECQVYPWRCLSFFASSLFLFGDSRERKEGDIRDSKVRRKFIQHFRLESNRRCRLLFSPSAFPTFSRINFYERASNYYKLLSIIKKKSIT